MSIYETIAAAPQDTLRGAAADPLYECPPRIEKSTWTALGDTIVSREHGMVRPRRDQCYTLRLDITGMSALKQRLVAEGTFTSRWDPEFSKIMQTVTQDLAQLYQARWCYTQSDEITLVVVPPQDSPRFEHFRGGKFQKLVSLTAARASGAATLLLAALRDHMRTRRIDETSRLWWPQRLYHRFMNTPLATPDPMAPIIIEFDCRMAVWDTPRDAFQLVLWRAYDCGVNGVSDAVHNEGGHVTHRGIMGGSTWIKLKWLEHAGLLPLPHHQAYGTLYQWGRVKRQGVNPLTGETVMVERGAVTKLSVNNIITAVQQGALEI